MKTTFLILAAALFGTIQFATAVEPDVHLHVSTKWKDCSFQIDPSLTQDQWKKFSKEAGEVIYFRPLIDSKPMGRGKFELSVLQWNTRIDETSDAWNNTFVHPDSEHWLIGGEQLPLPGLAFRAGVSKNIDAGIYWTKNFDANYGAWGAQVQYNFLNDSSGHWAASSRATVSSLYGPDDLNLRVYGLDLNASKEFRIHYPWLLIAPYAGLSAGVAHAHEKTEVVNLKDETHMDFRGTIGTVLKISIVRLGVEYNVAEVNSFSYKLGLAINIKH